jgi:hypothetical protein
MCAEKSLGKTRTPERTTRPTAERKHFDLPGQRRRTSTRRKNQGWRSDNRRRNQGWRSDNHRRNQGWRSDNHQKNQGCWTDSHQKNPDSSTSLYLLPFRFFSLSTEKSLHPTAFKSAYKTLNFVTDKKVRGIGCQTDSSPICSLFTIAVGDDLALIDLSQRPAAVSLRRAASSPPSAIRRAPVAGVTPAHDSGAELHCDCQGADRHP